MDSPLEYYCFVRMDKDEIVTEDDGSFSYWLTEESAIAVARKVHEDHPYMDLSNFGIAYVVVTITEFTPERVHRTLNINVLYDFKKVF